MSGNSTAMQGFSVTEEELVAMAAALGQEMARLGGSVATVESCTGGLLARLLTETAGSSAWFDRGWVTYSNQSKLDLVGVHASSLEAHGAVSAVVAREMAAGALRHSPAALSLAVTGIAGPGGAVPGKPVGTVCFGWGLILPGSGGEPLLVGEEQQFDGDRAAVRRQSAAYALFRAKDLLQQELRNRPPSA